MSPLFKPPSLSRFRATRAGLLALFCAGVLRVLTRCSAALRAAYPGLHICLSLWTCAIARVFSAALRLPRYCATLRLPTLGYTFVFPFGHALSRGCSIPLMSPFGLPSAGSVGSHPPGMSHPSGCSCSLPRNRPVAWFPASARWHVFRFLLPPALASRPLARPLWQRLCWLCHSPLTAKTTPLLPTPAIQPSPSAPAITPSPSAATAP